MHLQGYLVTLDFSEKTVRCHATVLMATHFVKVNPDVPITCVTEDGLLRRNAKQVMFKT